MICLHAVSFPTKSAGLYDMHAEHLLSIPIIPEALSHYGVILAACLVSADTAVKKIVMANMLRICVVLWLCIYEISISCILA